MTDPLEVRDEGGQGRPDQAAPRDPRGEWGLVELLALRTPSRMTAMLLDPQRHLANLDLLDYPRCDGQCRTQVVPARGAGVEVMIEEPGVDRFGRERGPLVLGVSGLSADAASVLALRRWWLGRLDDVRRGGLGRIRGVLAPRLWPSRLADPGGHQPRSMVRYEPSFAETDPRGSAT